MNQKFKHKSICILLLLFFMLPITCMEVDQSDQETQQKSSRKRKRDKDEAVPTVSARRKKNRLSKEALYYLWLHKETKASKYDNKKPFHEQKLSDASLALFLKIMPPEIQQIITEEVYAEQIDAIFIAKLLCDPGQPPQKVWLHGEPPIVSYGNKKVFLRCNCSSGCLSNHAFHISGPSDIYEEEKHRLRAPLYHAWKYVTEKSKEKNVTAPRLVIRETNGDLVTVHDKEVHRWPVGEQFTQNKKFFVKELSLETVLLLKHKQRTQDPLDIEKEQLHSSARENIEHLQKQATSIPRELRKIRREKQRKKADAEKAKEKADNEEV